jgi:ParB/RepB/Spo0J family partition protein
MRDVGYSSGGGVEPADAGAPEIIMVDVDRLRPDPEQPRRSFGEERLRALADTIKRQGLIEPIEVDEDWVIITGERRWRAAKLAGLRAVPARVLRGLTPEQKLERRLIENIQHEPLSDLEKAAAIKRLMELGNYTIPQVSQNVGLSHEEIRRLLSLLEAPPEVKQLVEERKLPPSIAGEIVYSLKDKPEAAVEVARRVARSEDNKLRLARAIITEVKLKEREPEIAPPPAEYSVVYADPPWRYEFAPDTSMSVELHYPTMETEEIKGYLSAKGIHVAPDAVLFLWATAPKLEDALEVMRAWGFRYRTNMVWVKDRTGMGLWFRGQHELLLLGVRGSPRPPAPADRPPSVLEAPRGEHSEKPEAVYEIIERMTPGAHRIELFARRRRPGWDAVGLELEPAPT